MGRSLMTRTTGLAAFAATALAGGLAHAQVVVKPEDGQIGLQPAATEVARMVHEFHDLLLIIITAITLFVTGLLVWVVLRYNRRANPVPKKFSHNTLIEILWTTLPVLILVVIAYKSFPLLYKSDVTPEVAESEIVDVKVYGRQWFWTYIYGSGEEAVEFDSYMVPEESIKPGQILQLSVDNPMVVPEDRVVRLSISASDVIHSFALPAFGIKTDAVPGRLNQTWFKVEEPGIYFGQCSEICGRRHAFMPIEIRVLPQEQYGRWRELLNASATEARAYLDQVQPLNATQVASVK